MSTESLDNIKIRTIFLLEIKYIHTHKKKSFLHFESKIQQMFQRYRKSVTMLEKTNSTSQGINNLLKKTSCVRGDNSLEKKLNL